MEKEYPIIHLPNGGIVAVDKEQQPDLADKYYDGLAGAVAMCYTTKTGEHGKKYFWKIIAAHPKIEGVPLLPVPTEKDDALTYLLNYYGCRDIKQLKRQEDDFDIDDAIKHMVGYKARAAKESFTKSFEQVLEEQLLAAGDTQLVNKEEEENPTIVVNKLWLKNFYKLAQEGKGSFSLEQGLPTTISALNRLISIWKSKKKASDIEVGTVDGLEMAKALIEEQLSDIKSLTNTTKPIAVVLEMCDIKDFMNDETYKRVYDMKRAQELWDKYKPYLIPKVVNDSVVVKQYKY